MQKNSDDAPWPVWLSSRVLALRQKGRGSNINLLPTVCTPSGDRTHNPGMSPDWESKHNFSVYGRMLQTTEPHLPEHGNAIY